MDDPEEPPAPSVDSLRSELSDLSGQVSRRRSEVSSKRQMLLDWKRVVTEAWRLNKEEIDEDVEQAIKKLQGIAHTLTKDKMRSQTKVVRDEMDRVASQLKTWDAQLARLDEDARVISRLPTLNPRDVSDLHEKVVILRDAFAEDVPATPEFLPPLPPRMHLDLSALNKEIEALQGVEVDAGPAPLFMPDLDNVSPGMMDSDGGHIFWVVKCGVREKVVVVTKIEFDFVHSLFASLSSSTSPRRESLEEEVKGCDEMAASLVGRRVFARNSALRDKENESKGKWCRGYIEAVDLSSNQVSIRFVDYGSIQRQTPMKQVFISRPEEWREDVLPLAIPCSLWSEAKYLNGPDLKFFFNDTVNHYRDMPNCVIRCVILGSLRNPPTGYTATATTVYRVRLEAYDEMSRELIADLGTAVVDKCAEMESRGGGNSTIRNQDVRENVSKLVQMERGEEGGEAEPIVAASCAGDAQPMGVDIRTLPLPPGVNLSQPPPAAHIPPLRRPEMFMNLANRCYRCELSDLPTCEYGLACLNNPEGPNKNWEPGMSCWKCGCDHKPSYCPLDQFCHVCKREHRICSKERRKSSKKTRNLSGRNDCTKRTDHRVCVYCGAKAEDDGRKSHGGEGSKLCPFKKTFFRKMRDLLIERGQWTHPISETEQPESQLPIEAKDVSLRQTSRSKARTTESFSSTSSVDAPLFHISTPSITSSSATLSNIFGSNSSLVDSVAAGFPAIDFNPFVPPVFNSGFSAAAYRASVTHTAEVEAPRKNTFSMSEAVVEQTPPSPRSLSLSCPDISKYKYTESSLSSLLSLGNIGASISQRSKAVALFEPNQIECARSRPLVARIKGEFAKPENLEGDGEKQRGVGAEDSVSVPLEAAVKEGEEDHGAAEEERSVVIVDEDEEVDVEVDVEVGEASVIVIDEVDTSDDLIILDINDETIVLDNTVDDDDDQARVEAAAVVDREAEAGIDADEDIESERTRAVNDSGVQSRQSGKEAEKHVGFVLDEVIFEVFAVTQNSEAAEEILDEETKISNSVEVVDTIILKEEGLGDVGPLLDPGSSCERERGLDDDPDAEVERAESIVISTKNKSPSSRKREHGESDNSAKKSPAPRMKESNSAHPEASSPSKTKGGKVGLSKREKKKKEKGKDIKDKRRRGSGAKENYQVLSPPTIGRIGCLAGSRDAVAELGEYPVVQSPDLDEETTMIASDRNVSPIDTSDTAKREGVNVVADVLVAEANYEPELEHVEQSVFKMAMEEEVGGNGPLDNDEGFVRKRQGEAVAPHEGSEMSEQGDGVVDNERPAKLEDQGQGELAKAEVTVDGKVPEPECGKGEKIKTSGSETIPSDSDALFTTAYSDTQLRDAVRSQSPEDPLNTQSAITRGKEDIPGDNVDDGANESVPSVVVEKILAKYPLLMKEDRDKTLKKGTCFRCEKKGHHFRDCPLRDCPLQAPSSNNDIVGACVKDRQPSDSWPPQNDVWTPLDQQVPFSLLNPTVPEFTPSMKPSKPTCKIPQFVNVSENSQLTLIDLKFEPRDEAQQKEFWDQIFFACTFTPKNSDLLIYNQMHKDLITLFSSGALARFDPTSAHDGELVCVFWGPEKLQRACICGRSNSNSFNVDLFDSGMTGQVISDNIFVLPDSYKIAPVALYHKFRLDVLPPGFMFAVSNQRYTVEMARFLHKQTKGKMFSAVVGKVDHQSGLGDVKNLEFPENTDPKPTPLLQLFFAAFNVVEMPKSSGAGRTGSAGAIYRPNHGGRNFTSPSISETAKQSAFGEANDPRLSSVDSHRRGLSGGNCGGTSGEPENEENSGAGGGGSRFGAWMSGSNPDQRSPPPRLPQHPPLLPPNQHPLHQPFQLRGHHPAAVSAMFNIANYGHDGRDEMWRRGGGDGGGRGGGHGFSGQRRVGQGHSFRGPPHHGNARNREQRNRENRRDGRDKGEGAKGGDGPRGIGDGPRGGDGARSGGGVRGGDGPRGGGDGARVSGESGRRGGESGREANDGGRGSSEAHGKADEVGHPPRQINHRQRKD